MTPTITESRCRSRPPSTGWLASAGRIAHGPDIAPTTVQVVLEQRLRDALALLNPDLPASAVDETFRRPE